MDSQEAHEQLYSFAKGKIHVAQHCIAVIVEDYAKQVFQAVDDMADEADAAYDLSMTPYDQGRADGINAVATFLGGL